jgi:hypothetical protein
MGQIRRGKSWPGPPEKKAGTARVESGMDNPPLRSAPNPNFKDMDKYF